MEATLYRRIGQRIRRAREAAQMSQEQLAHYLGYSSPATISLYESGQRRISIVDLQRIADHLGLPVSHFLEGGPVPEASFVQLRAREVHPAARPSLAAFVSFAQGQGGDPPILPPMLRRMTPNAAARELLQLSGVVKPPVSPWQVAEYLRVAVYLWDFPDEVSGIFVWFKGIASIGVNEDHPYVRQRFTVAHEIGHLVFNDDRELFVDFEDADITARHEDEAQRSLEKKANQLAANLLMPADWLRNELTRYHHDIFALTRRYEVSEQAMWFRLLNLQLVEEDQLHRPG